MRTRDELPSNRSFGLFFAVVIAGAGWYFSDGILSVQEYAFVGAALAFLAAAVFAPGLLLHLNRAWMALGMMLGRVLSPVAIGFLFFVAVTPYALVLRLLGRDELQLQMRPGQSHWRSRKPPGPSADSLTRQF